MVEPILYKADGGALEVRPANGKKFTLEELQECVKGLIELIYLPNERVMVVNEEGRILGLARNYEADAILRKELRADSMIVGDVLVCKYRMV